MHSPLAMALYIKYCQGHNRETLRDIYSQHDDFHSHALWFIRESYQKKVIIFYAPTISIDKLNLR